MAPHAQKIFHGHEDLNRYSLRTKHCENNCRVLRKLDASRIHGKEDFFLSMGLEMRRFGYDFCASENARKKKTYSDVKSRECSVVIRGASCHMCGKYFKCVTDVDIHIRIRHYVHTEMRYDYMNDVHHVTIGTNTPTRIEDFECASGTEKSAEKIRRNKSSKLHLTLKIGDEVVTRVAIKRKHLTARTIESGTQTELNVDTEPAMRSVENKSHDCRVASPDLCSDLRESRVPSTCASDKENLHFDDNIVSNDQVRYENRDLEKGRETAEYIRPSCLDRVTETQAPPINREKDKSSCYNTTPNKAPVLPNTTSTITSTQSSQPSSATKQDSNDEVQEVLRITRTKPGTTSREINHESPNRSERVILVLDAIKDMMRIEEHALCMFGETIWSQHFG